MLQRAFAILFGVLITHPVLAESLILVARPALEHPLYGRTVLAVTSFGAGQHLGFIVNRPTPYRLGDLFPGHAPSREVLEPVFIGGPFDLQVIFALVPRAESPGRGSIELMPGLYAVFDGKTVDRVIEANPQDARFLTGLVVWRPNELEQELARGFWYRLPSDASLAARQPHGLWEELLIRAQHIHNMHKTAHPD